jgi:PAS domain S-box-containing protein
VAEGIWGIGLDGNITFVNSSAVKMFGYESEEEMLGKNSHQLVHYKKADGSDYPQVDCPIYKAFQKGVAVFLQDEVLWRKDGSCFNADYRSTPVLNDGKITGAVITFIDTTAKLKAENDLVLWQEWLSATLKSIGDAVIATSGGSEPKIVFMNNVAEKLTGWDLEAAKGLPVLETFNIINQQTRAPAENPIERVLREGKVVGLANHTVLVSRNGKEYVIEDSAAPIRDKAGNISGVVLVFRDITEQSKAREHENKLHSEIEVARNQLKEISDSMPQIVWSANPDGMLDYFNTVWFQYSGTTFEENVGNGWAKAVHAEDIAKTAELWAVSLKTGIPYENEFRLRSAKGEYRWHVARAQPLYDEKGSVRKWHGTNTDIHDFKLLSEDLKVSRGEAESANAAKSAFLANMSHEIRTPLGAIMGFAELIAQPKVGRSEIGNYISVILRNSTQVLRIIDDILDLSKVEAGQMEIEHIEFSLPETLSDLSSLLGLKARENGIEFIMRAETAIPKIVVSDPTRLRQVLINIVGNAIKFTEKGKVEQVVSYKDGFLEFRVVDTGRGISAEQALKLFQPFIQADAATNRKYGGTGLGLVLARKLCQALGGDFYLEKSEVGKGSTFVAKVSVHVPDEGKIIDKDSISFNSDNSERVFDPSRNLEGMKVLVVEDSPDNQALITIILSNAGATVQIASNGQVGVQQALTGAFDAVLMDIQMPILDGFGALSELKSKGFKKPVIALTAHAMKEQRERCFEAGFSNFIPKPIHSQDLLDVLFKLRKTDIEVSQREQVTPHAGDSLKTEHGKYRILIVEDDDDTRELLESFLTHEGYEIMVSTSGEEACQVMDRLFSPHLILLDLTLPKMSGGEFLSILNQRADRQKFKVLIASGWDNLAARVKALKADGFLRKPMVIDDILAEISKATLSI